MSHPALSRISVVIALLALTSLQAFGQTTIRDIDISLDLTKKGSAIIHERWDVCTGNSITEWYLVRDNLGDIEIPILYVSDENACDYQNIGEWDPGRSLAEKAGKCGIVHRGDGALELCWGVGSHGDHVFDPVYGMTRVVKSLQDYDMLHLQVVSPGLSSPPQHVRVTVQINDIQLDTLNTRLWGFGFEGTAGIVDGKAVFESDAPLDTEDSVIILLRFEKGLMEPQSIQDRPFQDALDEALAESDYLQARKEQEEENPYASGIATFFTALVMFLIGRRMFRGAKKYAPVSGEKLLGGKAKDVPWYRDIPLDGNLEAASQLLKYTKVAQKLNLPMAQILRMIHQGYIAVTRDIEGPVRLSFPAGVSPAALDQPSSKLYDILKKAAGGNGLLEEKEFSTWLRSHDRDAYDWSRSVQRAADSYMDSHGIRLTAGNYEKASEQARYLVGLYRFLDDFTLSREREAFEVHLWKEYLVYAALFGIAEKVAAQMKDIRASLLEKELPYDLDSIGATCTTLYQMSRSFEDSVIRGTPVQSYSSSSSSGSSYSRSSGGGGRTSSGGGGGYSGGGRGGGGR